MALARHAISGRSGGPRALAGLEHEAGAQARALAHEVGWTADGQQRGTRGTLGPSRRSERIRMLTPAAIAALASSQASAGHGPSPGPSATGHVRSIVVRAEDVVRDVAAASRARCLRRSAGP